MRAIALAALLVACTHRVELAQLQAEEADGGAGGEPNQGAGPAAEGGDPIVPRGWEPQSFSAVDAFSDCSGGARYVSYAARYDKWIGAELCHPGRYKLFMGASQHGLFYEIADGSGHGQDHCELVDPSFTLPSDDDIQSGGCADCEIGSAFVTAVVGEGYTRDGVGQPFAFESPLNELAYTPDWYECGVTLP